MFSFDMIQKALESVDWFLSMHRELPVLDLRMNSDSTPYRHRLNKSIRHRIKIR